MALKVDVVANTRQFVSEMKKGGASVEDVSETLDELARDGDQALEKIERGFKDLAKQAQTTGKKVGTDLDKGFDKARKGADDFKQESGSTLRETAASIQGVEDAVGSLQEVAANAFVGFGPVGAGAGLVAALGLGLVTAEIGKQKEKADELKAALTQAYRDAAEEGRTWLSEQQILQEANRLIFEDGVRLRKEAEQIGVDVNTLARAYAGSEEDLNVALASGNDLQDKRLDKLKKAREESGDMVVSIDAESLATQQVVQALEEQERQMKLNKDRAADVLALKRESSAKEKQATNEQRELDKRRYDALIRQSEKAPKIVPKIDFKQAEAALAKWDPNKTIAVQVTYNRRRV